MHFLDAYLKPLMLRLLKRCPILFLEKVQLQPWSNAAEPADKYFQEHLKFAGAGLVLNSAGLGSSVWATGALTHLFVSSSCCVQFFSVWGGRGTVLCQQDRGGQGKHTDDWPHTHHLDVGVLHACVCVFAVFCSAISGLGGDIRGGNGSWQE